MASKPTNFSELVEHVYRRMRRYEAAHALGAALLLGGILSWSILFLFPATTSWLAALVGGGSGMGVALLMLVFHHPNRMLAAAACDEAAGAAELFTTALLLRGKWQTADPGWRRSIFARANEAAQQIDPVAIRVGSPRWSIIALGVAMLSGLFFWPAADGAMQMADSQDGSPSAVASINVVSPSPAAVSVAAPTAEKSAANDAAIASAVVAKGGEASSDRPALANSGMASAASSPDGRGGGLANSQQAADVSLAAAGHRLGETVADPDNAVASAGATAAATTQPTGEKEAGVGEVEVASDFATVPPPSDPGQTATVVGDPATARGGEVPAAYRDIAREYLTR